ncbi:hypothetical protein J3459_018196 [Metarhizium acridum]|nr:hypothetical protein J3459_018196 [Metarhizium acridum]
MRLVSSFSLAAACWYGSVHCMRPMQCSLWIWKPNPVNMSELREPAYKQSRRGQVEMQDLVQEDVLELEATQCAIHLWSDSAEAALGRDHGCELGQGLGTYRLRRPR